MPRITRRPLRQSTPVPERPERIDANQLYSVLEACGALSLSRARLYQMINAGQIKPVRLGDDRPRFPGAEIQRVIAAAQTAT